MTNLEAAKAFRVLVAYDGRPFEGWQSQPGGNTVQDHLLDALQRICQDILTVQGSGRTDTGVHALGQVAHFHVPATHRMEAEEWQRALNAHLPPAIRIFVCEPAPLDFHSRFDAVGKTYCYRVWIGDVLPPLEDGLCWHVRAGTGGPDLAIVERCLKRFHGTHDFRAFAANRGDGYDASRDTDRTITEARLAWEVEGAGDSGGALRLTYSGSGFLYRMVRLLTGAAFHCAFGRFSFEDFERLLDAPTPGEKAPYCAPACGLYLVQVAYPSPIFQK